MKTSPWLVHEGYCAMRIIEGGDPADISHRVAFIEKTPRVRIRDDCIGCRYVTGHGGNRQDADRQWPEFLNWTEGPKGDGGPGNPETQLLYGFDPESRAWCDRVLVALGYTLG